MSTCHVWIITCHLNCLGRCWLLVCVPPSSSRLWACDAVALWSRDNRPGETCKILTVVYFCAQRMVLWPRRNLTIDPFNETVTQVCLEHTAIYNMIACFSRPRHCCCGLCASLVSDCCRCLRASLRTVTGWTVPRCASLHTFTSKSWHGCSCMPQCIMQGGGVFVN